MCSGGSYKTEFEFKDVGKPDCCQTVPSKESAGPIYLAARSHRVCKAAVGSSALTPRLVQGQPTSKRSCAIVATRGRDASAADVAPYHVVGAFTSHY